MSKNSKYSGIENIHTGNVNELELRVILKMYVLKCHMCACILPTCSETNVLQSRVRDSSLFMVITRSDN